MALREKIGCRHRAKTSREVCWDHCVTPDRCAATPWRQAAHGGLTIVETCRCGATRETEANGEHRNVGPWTRA